MPRTDGITLQVSLATSDIAYARFNLPHLAGSHRAAVDEVLVTVDGTKPQRTKLADPDVRCPEPRFTQQVAELRDLAESLRRDGLVDRVLVLTPGDPWLATITRKYSGPWLPETHDYGGRPITGYWAGIEAAAHRYVIHYDGDMYLHQSPGFDWARHAIPFLERQPLAVSAAPRPTKPYARQIAWGDYASIHEGIPMFPVEGGWRHAFLSTRALLVDRHKLERHLPLGRGRILAEQMLVKTLRRGFPRSAEKMWWTTVGAAGGYRLILSSEDAWTLHPNWKPAHYAPLVPGIVAAVEAGEIPAEQYGKQELELDAWQAFLAVR